MSCQSHENKTDFHCEIHGVYGGDSLGRQHYDFLSPGGEGGRGGEGGVGGPGGVGEGPTLNFTGVQNVTNNMYVGDVPRSFSHSTSTMVFSGGSLVVHNDKLGLLNFSALNTFQAELRPD